MKKTLTPLAALLAASFVLFSCGHRPATGLFDPNEIKSVSLAAGDGGIRATLSGGDLRRISECLSYARYDTLLNDGGIMLRMAEPDYTLILTHQKAGASDDWAQIWIASGRTLFRSKWYTLRQEDLPGVEVILKKY